MDDNKTAFEKAWQKCLNFIHGIKYILNRIYGCVGLVVIY